MDETGLVVTMRCPNSRATSAGVKKNDMCVVCGPLPGYNVDSSESLANLVDHVNAGYYGYTKEGFVATEHTLVFLIFGRQGQGRKAGVL